MKSKPVTAWAVKHWKQGLYPHTIRRTRAEAVSAFVKLFLFANETWRGQGPIHTVVKVTVTDITPAVRRSIEENGR